MATFLADLMAYYSGNSTLTAAVPFSKVWTGLVPEKTAFPYIVFTPIASVPTNVTNGQGGYWETFTFQISIFDTDPDNVESVAATVAAQFDYRTISASCISCERTNGPVFIVDQATPELVYHAWLQFDYRRNQTGQ
jgi:hypothetical protein